MNVLSGTVIGWNTQLHRYQEFIRFLNAVGKQISVGKAIRAILDSHAARERPECAPTARTPPAMEAPIHSISASWRDAVEGLFATVTKRRLKRGVFRSLSDLRAAVDRFLEGHFQQFPAFHRDSRSRQNHRRRQARAPALDSIDSLLSSDGEEPGPASQRRNLLHLPQLRVTVT